MDSHSKEYPLGEGPSLRGCTLTSEYFKPLRAAISSTALASFLTGTLILLCGDIPLRFHYVVSSVSCSGSTLIGSLGEYHLIPQQATQGCWAQYKLYIIKNPLA